MAAGEQYLRLAINLVVILCMSRLLTPSEIGIAVIGTGTMAIVLGLREFATADFVIQRPEVTRQDICTAFTIILVLTALIASAVFGLAPWLAALYGEPGLARFLRVMAVAGLIEALALPVVGLLRREMAFGMLALLYASGAAVTAIAVISLALAGFSYMSFAWAALAAAATTAALSIVLRPVLAGFRPAIGSWRSVLSFGGYNGASFTINRLYESLPQLVLGQMLPSSAVGLYNRASVVSDIPDKITLSSVLAIAFPALAEQSRNGSSLKASYLLAVSHVTVLYWPAQVLLVLLAQPIVMLLLGDQWLEMVPVLQVMAVASFAWFPVALTAPVLLAVGANRDRTLADLVGRAVSAVVLCSSAAFGIMAMAASKLVTIPFQMAVSFHFVRRHLQLGWGELAASMAKSAIVTAASASGPACLVLFSGMSNERPLASAAIALALFATAWLAAVFLTRHPVLLEIRNLAGRMAGTRRPGRLLRLPVRLTGQAPKGGGAA
ncbi:oligosaccharide flippase family protein [Geminicoccaceae bacterium 1502E]|nr:oligosaccharide flippase family protein [Geminicoccaceae bacterium 1502E]